MAIRRLHLAKDGRRIRLKIDDGAEAPPLPEGAVAIDDTWLLANGGAAGPWTLGTASAYYYLDTDPTADGTAFVVTAAGVTLDLRGRTLTYNDAARPYAEDFEGGTIGEAPAGWTVGSTGAVVAANDAFLYGAQTLRVPSLVVSSTVSIESPSIAIPLADRTYTATVATGRDDGGATEVAVPAVRLKVVRVSDSVVLSDSGDGTNPIGRNGDGSVANQNGGGFRAKSAAASFLPTTTDAVKLVIEVTRASGESDHCHLDHVRLTRSCDHGVVCANSTFASGSSVNPFPGAYNLTSGQRTAYTSCGATTVTCSLGTGHVTQGAGAGHACDPIYSSPHRHARTFVDLHLDVTGDAVAAVFADTRALTDTGAVAVTGNTITYPARTTDVVNRESGRPAVRVEDQKNDVTVAGNTFVGLPWAAVGVGHSSGGLAAGHSLAVSDNTIGLESVVTNGYAILTHRTDDLTISGNTIAGFGRGPAIDVGPNMTVEGVTISGNTVDLRERGNREYGPYKSRSLRIRNIETNSVLRDVTVSGNSFTARCGGGADLSVEANGAMISLENNGTAPTGIAFSGNTWEALSEDSGGTAACKAFMLDGVEATAGVTMDGEIYRSNVEAVVLADFDGGADAGVFADCQIVKSTAGDTTRTFRPVRAGYFTHTVDVTFDTCTVDTGSGPVALTSGHVTLEGSGSKTITITP